MSAEISASTWRLVEIGRVVLVNDGPSAGKLAAIIEIVDHKRVLIDGPGQVPRQAIALAHVTLTPIVVPGIPRASRSGFVKKQWDATKVEEKWNSSGWAKKIASRERRRELSDFDRFKVMVLKKQRRFEVRKAAAKGAKAAKA